MKLVQRRFTASRRDGFWDRNGYSEICHDGLLEFFDVPDSAKVLWVSLHDRCAKTRVAARVVMDGRGGCEWPAIRLTCFVAVDCYNWNKLLKPHVGKTVYIEVEYQ